MVMAARSVSFSCIQSPSHRGPIARIFLQLTSLQPHPILDFLAPRFSKRIFYPTQQRLRFISKAESRGFSTSSARRETIAIHNPRKDDYGHAMTVEITQRASNRLREIMAKDENPNLALRITVESGGCHGFQYLMSLTTLPQLSSASMSAGEHISDTALNDSSSAANATPSAQEELNLDEDIVFEALDGSEAKVVMDGPSLELLKGSKIDYTMELIGSQFKIVDNPLATSSCGCGTSFDIKA